MAGREKITDEEALALATAAQAVDEASLDLRERQVALDRVKLALRVKYELADGDSIEPRTREIRRAGS